jgi:hypothetical protein
MANPQPAAPARKNNFIAADSVPVTNPQNLTAVYANHFGGTTTATDFTLYFLYMGTMPAATGGVVSRELKAAVTLPLAAAAGMVELLEQLIKANAQGVKEVASGPNLSSVEASVQK